MSQQTLYHDAKLVQQMLNVFVKDGYFNARFVHMIFKYMEHQVLLVQTNMHTDRTWDGELLLHFKTAPKASILVNDFIANARADEIQMQEDNVLRLWWD